MMRASTLPRAHATASSAKKSTRDAKRVFPVRFESSREDRLTCHFSPARFSESRVRMRLVLPLSDSTFSFAPIEKIKRARISLSLLRALSARERPPLARAVGADRNESTPLQNARSSRRSSFLPGNKRAQKRDKSAPNLLRLLKREGQEEEEEKEGKNWCKKKENEATKDEKKTTKEPKEGELITGEE